MAPQTLHGRRSRGPKTFAGSRRLLWLAGLALSLITLTIAYMAMSLGVATSALGVGDTSDFAQQRMSAAFRLASIPLVLAALAPMTLMRRFAMRALRTREAQDDRPPILLLRSFVDDSIRIRARGNQRRSLIDRLSLRRWERFEEVIAAALSAQGPVEAVSQVGERLPPALGAVRRQFTNDEWQERVRDLMSEAQLICIILGRSESLAWEIKRIRELGHLDKTVFVLPPTERGEHIRRLAVLADILDLDWVDLDVRPSGGWALAVRVPARGAVPEVARARAQEDVGYDIALEMMRLRILGWSWETTSLADEVKTTAPHAQVHARGEAPKTRSWLRRPWLILLLVNVTGAASLPFVFLTGGDAQATAILDLGSSSAWDVAADPDAGGTFAIIDGRGIYRISVEKGDHPSIEAHRLAEIDTAEFLTADDGWLIASNHVDGTLQAVAPGGSSPAWKRDDLPGVKRVVADGDRLYLALPSQRRILTIDRATGKDVADQTIEGVPWALTVVNDDLAVALADRDGVLTLGLDDLRPTGRLDTTAPSTALATASGDLWAYHPREHALEVVAGPDTGKRIATRSEQPLLASNETVLAVSGVEIISTLRPSSELHRHRYLFGQPSTMAVTTSGDVLLSSDNLLVFVRTSVA